MTIGQLSIMVGVFSSVFTGSMYLVNESMKTEIHLLGDSLRYDIQKEVGKYQNVYTASEIVELANDSRVKDNEDFKQLIKDENKELKNYLKSYIKVERSKYDTIFFEDANGVKFMELGYMVDGKFFLLKEVQINKFPFE